jgi:hypothetical protein
MELLVLLLAVSGALMVYSAIKNVAPRDVIKDVFGGMGGHRSAGTVTGGR